MKKATLCIFIVLLFTACSQKIKNKIITENLLPDTTDWCIDVDYEICNYPDHQFCWRPQIEGYCSQTSVSQKDMNKRSLK